MRDYYPITNINDYLKEKLPVPEAPGGLVWHTDENTTRFSVRGTQEGQRICYFSTVKCHDHLPNSNTTGTLHRDETDLPSTLTPYLSSPLALYPWTTCVLPHTQDSRFPLNCGLPCN